MKDDIKCLIGGIFIGFLISNILHTMPFANAERAREEIRNCEKTLPRDQHCVVTAVPGVQNERAP